MTSNSGVTSYLTYGKCSYSWPAQILTTVQIRN